MNECLRTCEGLILTSRELKPGQDTNVTDAACRRLQQALPNCKIERLKCPVRNPPMPHMPPGTMEALPSVHCRA